jgi:hypothetical protein
MSMAGREQSGEMGKKKRNNLNPKPGLKVPLTKKRTLFIINVTFG